MGCARTFFDTSTGQSTGFICGAGIIPCAVCGTVAEHLCDYPLGKGTTCDAPLCRNHAIAVRPFPQNRPRVAATGDDEDQDTEWVEFCPQHYAMFGKQ